MSPSIDCSKQYHKCTGCIHCGPTFPCEYILNTGHSPQSQGVQLNPYGRGGCPLKDTGSRQTRRADPVTGRVAKIGAPNRYVVDHERALALYQQGLSDPAIARELEVPRASVSRWRKAHELEAKHRHSLPGVDKRHGKSVFDSPDIMEAYQNGANDQELARMVGCTKDAARYWRHRRGLPPNYQRGSH